MSSQTSHQQYIRDLTAVKRYAEKLITLAEQGIHDPWVAEVLADAAKAIPETAKALPWKDIATVTLVRDDEAMQVPGPVESAMLAQGPECPRCLRTPDDQGRCACGS